MPSYIWEDYFPFIERTEIMDSAEGAVLSQTAPAPPPVPTSAPSTSGTTTTAAPSISRTIDQAIVRVPDSTALNGPRSDLASGWGIRVRFGLLSDGSYGIERYTASGTRQVPTWS